MSRTAASLAALVACSLSSGCASAPRDVVATETVADVTRVAADTTIVVALRDGQRRTWGRGALVTRVPTGLVIDPGPEGAVELIPADDIAAVEVERSVARMPARRAPHDDTGLRVIVGLTAVGAVVAGVLVAMSADRVSGALDGLDRIGGRAR